MRRALTTCYLHKAVAWTRDPIKGRLHVCEECAPLHAHAYRLYDIETDELWRMT